MGFFRSRVRSLPSPKVGILNVAGEYGKGLIEADLALLTGAFVRVEVLERSVPKCDVLFLYGRLTAAGAVEGLGQGLREVIRDSGAKVVIVALENPVEHYIKAGAAKAYGQANLVMTLDRRGDAFARFFSNLFSMMKRGDSMSSAWAELCPQVPDMEHPGCPDTIFACEIGPLAFR